MNEEVKTDRFECANCSADAETFYTLRRNGKIVALIPRCLNCREKIRDKLLEFRNTMTEALAAWDRLDEIEATEATDHNFAMEAAYGSHGQA